MYTTLITPALYTMEDLLRPFFSLRDSEEEIRSSNRQAWWKD